MLPHASFAVSSISLFLLFDVVLLLISSVAGSVLSVAVVVVYCSSVVCFFCFVGC